MPIFEESNKSEFQNSKYAGVLKNAGKYMVKVRVHIFIMVVAVVYLAFAPGIYTKYFVKLGKPAELKIDPPAGSPLISYNIDSTGESNVSNQQVYQIVGWAFLENEPDQKIFDKYLVLNSNDQVYYFQYEQSLRWDINNYFQDLGLNLLNTGFWAFIAPEAIRTGTYNIGLMFLGKTGEKVYYTCSDRYIVRTPNSISIETGALPDESTVVISPPADNSLQYGSSKQPGPIRVGTDKEIQYGIEGLSTVTITGREYGRLTGWAFLQDETDQSKYAKWVVLESDEVTLYFPVKSIERPDVPKVYPELTSRFSGFFADIFKEALPPGTYQVGLLFKSRSQEPSYIVSTPWIITRTFSEFEFGIK